MHKDTLILSLYKIGAIQFGEFTLKNGKTSSVYVNLRKIISYPDILRTIAATIWEAVRHCQFDLVCGVPYTALPIATCLSLDQNIPMIIRRKEKKEYGTKQLIEGVFQAGQRCLIIEDIITTGGSIRETAKDLTEAGLHIHDVIALIDREEGAKENLSRDYQTHTILTLLEILQTLQASSVLTPHEQNLIKLFLTEKMGK